MPAPTPVISADSLDNTCNTLSYHEEGGDAQLSPSASGSASLLSSYASSPLTKTGTTPGPTRVYRGDALKTEKERLLAEKLYEAERQLKNIQSGHEELVDENAVLRVTIEKMQHQTELCEDEMEMLRRVNFASTRGHSQRQSSPNATRYSGSLGRVSTNTSALPSARTSDGPVIAYCPSCEEQHHTERLNRGDVIERCTQTVGDHEDVAHPFGDEYLESADCTVRSAVSEACYSDFYNSPRGDSLENGSFAPQILQLGGRGSVGPTPRDYPGSEADGSSSNPAIPRLPLGAGGTNKLNPFNPLLSARGGQLSARGPAPHTMTTPRSPPPKMYSDTPRVPHLANNQGGAGVPASILTNRSGNVTPEMKSARRSSVQLPPLDREELASLQAALEVAQREARLYKEETLRLRLEVVQKQEEQRKPPSLPAVSSGTALVDCSTETVVFDATTTTAAMEDSGVQTPTPRATPIELAPLSPEKETQTEVDEKSEAGVEEAAAAETTPASASVATVIRKSLMILFILLVAFEPFVDHLIKKQKQQQQQQLVADTEMALVPMPADKALSTNPATTAAARPFDNTTMCSSISTKVVVEDVESSATCAIQAPSRKVAVVAEAAPAPPVVVDRKLVDASKVAEGLKTVMDHKTSVGAAGAAAQVARGFSTQQLQMAVVGVLGIAVTAGMTWTQHMWM